MLYDEHAISFKRGVPFEEKKVNSGYQRLAQIGSEFNLRFIFSKPSQYRKKKIMHGMVYDYGGWQQVHNVPVSTVYDKFNLTEKNLRLRRQMSRELLLVNHPDISKLCMDKWLMYCAFAQMSVPTFPVASHAEARNIALREGYRKVVLKPRIGSGGDDVSIVAADKIPHRIGKDTLLQPFIDSRSNTFGATMANDVRVIVLNGRPDHAYVRRASAGLRSNVALGGTVHHLPLEQVPRSILAKIRKIDARLRQYRPRLYTVDFLVDGQGRAWLGEMNAQPALYLYTDEGVQEQFFRKLCRALSV